MKRHIAIIFAVLAVLATLGAFAALFSAHGAILAGDKYAREAFTNSGMLFCLAAVVAALFASAFSD